MNSELLKAVLEVCKEPIGLIDKNWKLLEFNKQFCGIFRSIYKIDLKKNDDLIERIAEIHLESAAFWKSTLYKAIEKSTPECTHCPINYGEDHKLFLEISPIIINNSADALMLRLSDSFQTKTEKPLVANETLYRKLFETATDAIIIMQDKTYVCLESNPTAVSYFECSENVIIGSSIEIFFPYFQFQNNK